MAFKIRKYKVKSETYHIGTYALPSDHAISVHCEITSGQPPKWIYSEDPKMLQPVDKAYWDATIKPTLQYELKQKTGVNRFTSRRLTKMKEHSVGHVSR